MLIPAAKLRDASDAAYQAMNSFLGSTTPPGKMLFDEESATETLSYANTFAQKVSGAKRVSFRKMPPGFGSWLMREEGKGGKYVPGIAINAGQIREWVVGHKKWHWPFKTFREWWPGFSKHKKATKKYQRYLEAVLTARCIYHEVGHIKLHSHLLNHPGPNTAAPWSSKEDEEQAWVFAFLVLGMIVGDYAEMRRHHKNFDDSPARLV